MAQAPQNYKNHTRFFPIFHYFVLPVMLVNVMMAGGRLFPEPDLAKGWNFIFAIALMILAVLARVFALKAQDRVIRLEMRLKLRELLPADQHANILTLTPEQMVGLRFASDAELPGLVARVLKDGLTRAKPIKLLVKDWQADHARV